MVRLRERIKASKGKTKNRTADLLVRAYHKGNVKEVLYQILNTKV